MAFSSFKSLRQLKKTFGLEEAREGLFHVTEGVVPSQWLLQSLKFASDAGLAYYSEKSRSESIVFPILLELLQNTNPRPALYSGAILEPDKASELNGECDFVLGLGIQSIEVNTPIFCLVEAKDNDIELGIPQCAAQMIGARILNEQDNIIIPKIYGAVTTGTEWFFLKLEKNILTLDARQYQLVNLNELLAVLLQIVQEANSWLENK